MQFVKVILRLLLLVSLPASAGAQAQTKDEVPARLETHTNIYMEAAYRQFDMHLADCTKKFGYDPDKVPANLGDYEIAPGEDEWRACAYEGVEKTLMPKTRSPALYESLINTHKILTEQMQRQLVSRKERRAKIEELIANIQLEEAKAMNAGSTSAAQETDANRTELVRRQVDMLRGFSGMSP